MAGACCATSDGDDGTFGGDGASNEGAEGASPRGLLPLVGAARGGMALARAPLLASRLNAKVWAFLAAGGRGGLVCGRGGSRDGTAGLVAAAEGIATGDETAGDDVAEGPGRTDEGGGATSAAGASPSALRTT